MPRTARLTALLVTLALGVLPGTAAAHCGRATDVDPAAPGGSPHSARSATLCLLNAERHARGERRLRFNRRLGLAALRHARDMVEHGYFAHTAPSGENFVQRIFKTNYVPPAAAWLLGENLAWGPPADATPRQIVRAWMLSPEHRANILTARFREIGVAVVVGAPFSGHPGAATYDTEFGVIHRL